LFGGVLAVPARAQFNSGFTGIVTEQSDAAVPNAKVIVTNQDTHVSRYAISTDSGDFRIASLPGGLYTVEVQASGFKDWTQKDVLLESNEVKTLHPVLALPTQTTTVEVTGAVGLEQHIAGTVGNQYQRCSAAGPQRVYEHD
jgi:hypothetical protein